MITELIVFGEILLAGFLGGLVGFEREVADKPAGLRTHVLVAVSAALIIAMGSFLIRDSEFPSAVRTDPIRIIEAIIVGVSFIGAGTILQRERDGRIDGLTTAASLLVTAVIGIAVSLQLYILAVLTTATILIVNRGLNYMERRMKDAVDK